MKRYAAVLFLLSWLLVMSCRSDPPALQDMDWQLEAYRSCIESPIEVYLHISAEIYEPQGYEDLVSIVITGPGEMVWNLDPQEIPYRQEGSTFFLKIGRLAPIPGSTRFPAGTYRITVSDIPGNKDEQEFFLPRPSSAYVDPQRFAQIFTEDSETAADGEYTLLHISAAGKVIRSEQVEGWTVLFPRDNQPAYYYIISSDQESRMNYSYGPVFPKGSDEHP